MIPTVLFFAREFQASFFPALTSTKYNSVYVTVNKDEKKTVLDKGGKNVVCLEEEFDTLPVDDIKPYLEYSYGCDRSYVRLTLTERELILKKEIAFWRKIFDEFKPDIIINETVAIEISEVLANEAKKRNIRYHSWMSFSKKNTFFWKVDPFHTSLQPYLSEVIPSEDNIEEAVSFVEGLRKGTEKPFYVQNITHRHSLYKFAQNIWGVIREIPLKLKYTRTKHAALYGTSYDLRVRNIKLFFLSIFSFESKYDNIDNYKDREIVFYPLHFEPEAVLFYMAYFFDNQVAFIENILKCLDVNQVLAVKEHPQQAGMLLERKFKKIKERYPNVIFIRGEEPTIKILKACDIIVTLGSTAGFEGLALGKKVINLGRVFYDSFEGVNNCKSFEEVYDLLRGSVPFKFPNNFELFVAKCLKYIKPGNPVFNDQLLSDDNVNAIRKAIEDELVIQN